MRIAFISDIHGNVQALQAVLPTIQSSDMIVCCGDLVGYYPDVNEVCLAIRSINPRIVRGNHDAYVCGYLKPDPQKEKSYMTSWTRAQLVQENYHWLDALPSEIHFTCEGLNITVRHASPWDEETYLYPDSPKLLDINLGENEILVLGHTHHPMIKQLGQGILINPGSVGQPRDWNPCASYATLETDTRNIEIQREPYDVNAFQGRLRIMGWNEGAIQILSRERGGT